MTKTTQQIKQAIAGIVVLAASVVTPKAAIADFYDGFRGPQTFQLDQRLTLSADNVTYTLLPKAFIDTDRDGTGVFAVAPVMHTPGTAPAAGIGIGAFVKIGESAGLLSVVPVVYDGEHQTTTVAPTAYATFGVGNILFDPRMSYAATTNKQVSHLASAGTTIGYQHGRVIVGLDTEVGSSLTKLSVDSLIESLAIQGIIRIDLDGQHTNWLQTYVAPHSITGAWRTNF